MIAFVFPGQGAHYTGMGNLILRQHPTALRLAEAAGARLGIDLRRICLQGPDLVLQQTENAQPAILLLSLVLLQALAERGIVPQAVAGHSLGEYAALVAAGGVDPLDALALVRARGLAMAAATEGTMAAVLGLSDAEVEAACRAAGGAVVPANYNAPGQLVISGEVAAVERATRLLQERGARRVVALPVGGAFHSPLMGVATQRLKSALATLSLQPLRLPMAFNVDAAIHQDVPTVRRLMAEQLTAPVRWSRCVQTLWELGVRSFVEVGPRRTLTALIRRILPEARVHPVEDLDSLPRAAHAIQ